LPSKIGMQLRN